MRTYIYAAWLCCAEWSGGPGRVLFDVLATSSSPHSRRHPSASPLFAPVCCLKHRSRSRPSRGYVAIYIASVHSSVSLSACVGVPQLLHNSPDAVCCYSPILAVTEAATPGIRSTRTTTPRFGSGLTTCCYPMSVQSPGDRT